MYVIGDKIVHPMHGAGVVEDIVENRINGVTRSYYVLKLPTGGMTVMIPTANCQEIGVRCVCSAEEAQRLLSAIAGIVVENDQNWNRRYRENMVRLKSGDLLQVAGVVKSLTARDQEKGLSTGERKMLHTARQILVSEIVMALSATLDEVDRLLNEAMA